MIELSVAMPLYRGKYIVWLAFESLIRQRGINFEWELIVVEELNNESVGYEQLTKYYKILKEIGCRRLQYIELNSWIPLAEKVGLLIDQTTSNSRILTFGIADYYSFPLRLRTCYDAFKNDIDWFRTKKLIYYNLFSGSIVEREISDRGSCCKAVSLDIARRIEKGSAWRGVDGWFYRSCITAKGTDLKVFIDSSDNWMYGFNTHGFNNISYNRGRKIDELTNSFVKSSVDLTKTIPEEVLNRLNSCRKKLSNHMMDLPPLLEEIKVGKERKL
jgi:hypothetical protein